MSSERLIFFGKNVSIIKPKKQVSSKLFLKYRAITNDIKLANEEDGSA